MLNVSAHSLALEGTSISDNVVTTRMENYVGFSLDRVCVCVPVTFIPKCRT